VQLYVHDKQSKLVRPHKELKGFTKVALEPGETKTVSIALDFRSFAYYHPGYKQWITEDGDFEILIGSSVQDIHLRETVTVKSTLKLPSLLNMDSTLKEWLEDERGHATIVPIIDKMAKQMGAAMGASESGDVIGMNMMTFLMDLPLLSIFHFQDKMLSESPEEIVTGLLKQINNTSFI
jgi:beta-glucosidase